MSGRYTLLGKLAVPCFDLRTWAKWYEANIGKRSVGDDTLRRTVDGQPIAIRVSTVFLALDHNHFGDGDPLLFETMVFGGPHDQDQWRYATWDEAERGHSAVLEREKTWLMGEEE
jgi:hypothetical protein